MHITYQTTLEYIHSYIHHNFTRVLAVPYTLHPTFEAKALLEILATPLSGTSRKRKTSSPLARLSRHPRPRTVRLPPPSLRSQAATWPIPSSYHTHFAAAATFTTQTSSHLSQRKLPLAHLCTRNLQKKKPPLSSSRLPAILTARRCFMTRRQVGAFVLRAHASQSLVTYQHLPSLFRSNFIADSRAGATFIRCAHNSELQLNLLLRPPREIT